MKKETTNTMNQLAFCHEVIHKFTVIDTRIHDIVNKGLNKENEFDIICKV